jgi:broad specificity phosphatase PhoE
MKLIIVRHAEAEHNVGPLMVAHGPSRLTEKGKAQVVRVAERLKSEHIDVAFSSDSERALHTAKGILLFHSDVPLIKTKELGERHMGEMEGKPREEFMAAAEQSGVKWYEYRPTGGESMLETRDRAVHFIERIRQDNAGKTVLIVSHMGYIRALLVYLLKHDYEKDRPIRTVNTGVTVVQMRDDDSHIAHIINDASHLDDETRSDYY